MAHRVDSNWLGIFILDDSCVQSECRCLVDNVGISNLNDTQLLVTANVVGATCGVHGPTAVGIPIPIP
ncbi:unnamed protein product [Rotaria sordida]|nr:unnamed protein product [Rotaria sordida]